MLRGDIRNEEIIAAALAEKQARTEAQEKVTSAPHARIKPMKSAESVQIVKVRPIERPAVVGRRKQRA
jgi:hypothetical protein